MAEVGEALPVISLKERGRNLLPSLSHPTRDWLRALQVISNQWRWSVLFAVVVVVIVTAATLVMKPVYESEGRLQIDPPGAEAFSLDATGVGLIDSEYITTEVQKLQTDDLALATIQSLHLDRNPEFIKQVPNQPTAISGSDQLAPNEMAVLRPFQSGLSIRRGPSSRLVGVTFAAHDPRLSATVVNTLMKLMVQRSSEARSQAIAESSMWLSSQLDDIREKMESSTHALASFGAKTGIADVDPNSNTYAEKMGGLNQQLVLSKADRIQFQSTTDPKPLPQVRNNLVIQALTKRLAEADSQLAQSRVIYGPNHAEVRKLQNQVNELQDQINAQRAEIVSELSD